MVESNLHYLAFDEVGITVAVIATAFAFIVLTWNAVKAIHDWRVMAKKPVNDKFEGQAAMLQNHEDRISHLEGCCSEVQSKLANDWEFQQEEMEMNRILLKSIKQLLKHSIDGNDRDGLIAMEGEIDNYLLEHQR